MRILCALVVWILLGYLPCHATTELDPASAVIQTILDYPKLEIFLHPNVEGRVPVLISGQMLPSRVRIVKYGRDVLRMNLSETEGKPVIIFDELTITSSESKVRLRYPAEGIHASFTLTKKSDLWTVERVQITER